MQIFDPAEPLNQKFRSAIGGIISDFLDTKELELEKIDASFTHLLSLARGFTFGGKRLRPAFCIWGYLGVNEPVASQPLLRAAAAFDLLHVAELIHDDVMDDSATRRGMPAAHVQLAQLHKKYAWQQSAEAFGKSGAIILGDLLSKWATQLLLSAGYVDALPRALPIWYAVNQEVSAGQFLDIQAQTQDINLLRNDPETTLQLIHRVVEYKTARYTIIRPLHLGAALAGASTEIATVFANYGSALGRAFQYRDDILGVFGNPAITGKPAGGDIIEGKLTILIAETLRRAKEPAATQLVEMLGNPNADIATAQEIIKNCGALAATEAMIQNDLATALQALDARLISPAGISALHKLAIQSTARNN